MMLNILIWKHIVASSLLSQAKVIKLVVVVSMEDQRGMRSVERNELQTFRHKTANARKTFTPSRRHILSTRCISNLHTCSLTCKAMLD